MSKIWFSKMLILSLLFITTLSSFANNTAEGLTIQSGERWYDAPWVWTAAAGLFLFALVIVLRIGTRRADV